LDLRSLVPLGTPSAWLFLVRLHACRAGLRFTRQNQYTLCCPNGLKENKRIRVERRFRRVEDWSGRPDASSGWAPVATVEEKGRPGTRLRRIASGRKQNQVLRPKRPTRIEGRRRHRLSEPASRQVKPPVGGATRSDSLTDLWTASKNVERGRRPLGSGVRGAHKPTRETKNKLALDTNEFIEGTRRPCVGYLYNHLSPARILILYPLTRTGRSSRSG